MAYDDTIFRLKIEKPDGSPVLPDGRRVWIEITPPHIVALSEPIDYTDLPYDVSVGDITGEAGYPDIVLGMQDAAKASLTFDLTAFGPAGITDPALLRLSILAPEIDGTITTTGYSRAIKLPMYYRFLHDDGTAAEPSVVFFEGVQQRAATMKGTFGTEQRSIRATVELVEVGRWLTETLVPADVCEAMYLGTGEGPYLACYSTIWDDDDVTYFHAHADPSTAPDASRRVKTFYRHADLYGTIGTLAQQLYRKLTRRDDVYCQLLSEIIPTVNEASPLDHWTLHEATHTKGQPAGDAIDPADLWFLGVEAFAADLTLPVGGFLYYGEDSRRDQLGRWKTIWDYLRDVTAAAVVKVGQQNGGGTLYAFTFVRLDEPLPAGDVPIVPGPGGSFRSDVDYEIGAMVISGARAAIPEASDSDLPTIEVPAAWGSVGDDEWGLPAAWHNLPVLWPDGERTYSDGGDAIVAGSNGARGVRVEETNYMTLWYLSDAGGLLSSPRMIRAHHGCSVSDGTTDHDVSGSPGDLPTPDPDDVPLGATGAATSETHLGTPLRVWYLNVQRTLGMPITGASAVVARHSTPQQTTYAGELSSAALDPSDVGTVCDPADFPDGSAFASGATWLGTLPGPPKVRSLSWNITTGTSTIGLIGE